MEVPRHDMAPALDELTMAEVIIQNSPVIASHVSKSYNHHFRGGGY